MLEFHVTMMMCILLQGQPHCFTARVEEHLSYEECWEHATDPARLRNFVEDAKADGIAVLQASPFCESVSVEEPPLS